MSSYYIKIDTLPIAKARARLGKGHWFTPDRTAAYEKLIGQEFVIKHRHPLLKGPLRLSVTFRFPVPKRLSSRDAAKMVGQPHYQKPDGDNCLKAIKDALNEIAWVDDCQIAEFRVVKLWGYAPSVAIDVETMDGG